MRLHQNHHAGSGSSQAAQDLKDHFLPMGDIIFCTIHGGWNGGVIERLLRLLCPNGPGNVHINIHINISQYQSFTEVPFHVDAVVAVVPFPSAAASRTARLSFPDAKSVGEPGWRDRESEQNDSPKQSLSGKIKNVKVWPSGSDLIEIYGW